FLALGFLAPTVSVELFLLLARLLLEHVALDVRALAAYFHVDRAGASLAAGKAQLALGLALQRDTSRRRGGRVLAAVRAPQVSEQLELRVLADLVLSAGDLDACLVELHQQALDRHFQHFGKLRDRYFRHSTLLDLKLAARRTSAPAPP